MPCRHTGWMSAYELLFCAAGYPEVNERAITKVLIAQGYSRIAKSRSLGLLDVDMPYAAAALSLGTGYTNTLTTIGGVRSALQNFGVIWVAMRIPVDIHNIQGAKHNHITVVVDVNEDLDEIAIVNSCKENSYNTPNKAWVDFSWFRRGVEHTQDLPAGYQYFKDRSTRSDEPSKNAPLPSGRATFDAISQQ